MSDILLHLWPLVVATLLYAGLGVHFWRTRWYDADRHPSPLSMQPWERIAIAVTLGLHGIGLYESLLSAGGLRFSFSHAASLMLWLAVLIYWLESFRSRMDGMQPMVLPLASLASLLTIVFPQTHEIAYANTIAFRSHFLSAMAAYSLFTLAALHALFMRLIEHKLHTRTIDRRLTSLPSILSMEALLFRMIGIAFFLLTLAIASGAVFSEQIFGDALVFDHKTVFAFASWGIFAALLGGRHVYGWRGRIALRWTLAGFLLLILAYIGTRFVLEVLLERT